MASNHYAWCISLNMAHLHTSKEMYNWPVLIPGRETDEIVEKSEKSVEEAQNFILSVW